MTLFTGRTLENRLSSARTAVTTRATMISEELIRQTATAVADLISVGEVEPLAVDRSGATFEPTEDGAQISVTLTVPVSGDDLGLS